MSKLKIGVIFGGMSTEHDISVISGKSIIDNLNKEKYEILPIYIDEQGKWYKCEEITKNNEVKTNSEIENIVEYLKKVDVVFPVLHGKYGEDGTIQGMLELLKVKTVGCGVLASSVAMDKVYAKIIFKKANLKQAKYVYLRKRQNKYFYVDENFDEIIEDATDIFKLIEKKLKYPMFIKPSNSGSSVGINKANNIEELKKSIEYAGKFDNKILIEEGIKGREIECAVLGTDNVFASCVGEIKPAEDFYSFDAKYKNAESKLTIPANISKEISTKIKFLAKKAFKAIDGKGLSRVDFFVEDGTEEIYINEINTLPGFTSISMYPKLWEHEGIGYSELLDEIIKTEL